MGDFRGSDAQRFCPLIYERPFHNVSLWERVFLGHRSSCEVVITPFGHYDAGFNAGAHPEDFILQCTTNIQQQHIWRYDFP